ncbi:signal protein [Amycolatopsis sp. SID8362]|nr:signal protein [Amycolatopsis sp. SID8362]
MPGMENFAMGQWMLVLSCLTSVVGCALGLACTVQARQAISRGSRLTWLGLAAVSIGGVGIWLMHFTAMLGVETPGYPVRYSIMPTAGSALLAVAAVFCGLLVFGVRVNFAWWRLLLGGLLTGLAVNIMHYTGMSAIRIKGTVSYDTWLVALSVVIAVVAATAALWFTVGLKSFVMRILAGLIMTVAVTGMHYTGMAAMKVHLTPDAPDPAGVEVFSFLFPVFVVAALALAAPLCAVMMVPTPGEKAEAAGLVELPNDVVPDLRGRRVT